MKQLKGSYPLFGYGCGRVKVKVGGKSDAMVLVDSDILSIATSRQQAHDSIVCNFVCDWVYKVANAFKPYNFARALGWWVLAPSLKKISPVDTGCHYLHQYFSLGVVVRCVTLIDEETRVAI